VANTLRILSEIAQNTSQTTLDQFHSLISAHQYRLSHALVRRFLPPGAHVLDWGVGNGHFSFFLTREGYRATGYSLLIAGVWNAFDMILERALNPICQNFAVVARRGGSQQSRPAHLTV
jgi:cyclopropane fatty-acyl-phospholipid synthase-like methyltransferase